MKPTYMNKINAANNTTNTYSKGVNKMKTTGIFKRILAGVLSAATIFTSAPALAATAYADTANNVAVSSYKGNSLYYSDNYFGHSSTQFDPHLATLSCILTNFSVPLENPKSTEDTNWYQNQPERLHGFFDSIGFQEFMTNADYQSRSRFDSIGVGAACKKVGDYTVIGIGIRSGGYFREWANNVYLGDGTKSDFMHEGWYNAALKTLDFLNEYISTKNITGKIKVWIAGFSRGGATANLTAGLLDNRFSNNEYVFQNGATLTRDDLYAYTFEAPQGANYNSQTVRKPGDPIYNNIFNIVNPNDLVPKVAMSEYGFTRFGTDKFITTKFFDPAGYENNRRTLKALYVENGSKESDYNADNFEMYGTPINKMAPLVAEIVGLLPVGVADVYSQIKSGKIDFLVKDKTKANYDANIATYLLLEELTKNIGSRNEYCKTYQNGVRDFLMIMANDVNALKKDEIYTLISKLLLGKIVSTVVPGFGYLTSKAIQEAMPGANADQIIETIDPLLGAIGKVYWERPNELISLALYIKEVFKNHDNGVNIAHLEAQDNYYIDAYNAKNGKNLTLVGLRDSADFGRVTFEDYNDIGLFNANGSKILVRVEGAKGIKSTVKKCEPGYAVGYYSYLKEEGMELFMPVNQKYMLNMKGYSLKPYHTVSYSAFYQSVSPNAEHRFRAVRDSFSDWFCGNTKFRQIGLNMNF